MQSSASGTLNVEYTSASLIHPERQVGALQHEPLETKKKEVHRE